MTEDKKLLLKNYRNTKNRKENKFSKFIVALVIMLNSFFTIGTLYVFLRTGAEPTVLIAAWFAFTTGELWMLTNIKKTKIKKENNYEDKLGTEINE